MGDVFGIASLAPCFIELSPISGEGHDGSFAIDEATGEIGRNSVAVGELEPDPEEE